MKNRILGTIVAALVLVGVALVPVLQTNAGPEKVTICHSPPGQPEKTEEIETGSSALQTHLNHGDVLGSCVVATTPPTATQPPPTEVPSSTVVAEPTFVAPTQPPPPPTEAP